MLKLNKLMALSLVMLSTSLMADEVSIRTAKGDVLVPEKPQTMVVYDYLSLDTLDALGVTLPGRPPKIYIDYIDNFVEDPVIIGSSSEPNYEAVVKMNPDLFVIGGGSSKLMEPLSKIAPTIDMYVRGEDHVEQMLARLEDFAALTGTEEKAVVLAQQFHQTMAKAQAAVKGKGKTLILMTNGGKISTFGAASRFGWLFTDVGLVEAAEGIEAKSHGESVSFEYVAEVNPDYILVVDRSAAIGRKSEAAAVTLDNPLVNNTKAGKAGNLIFLSPGPAYVTGGGYQGMMIVLENIIKGFGAK